MSGRIKRWVARLLMAMMCISCALPVYAATTKDKINSKKNQIATAYSLGLRKVNSVTTQPDNEATKGKIKTIAHLVKVEEV